MQTTNTRDAMPPKTPMRANRWDPRAWGSGKRAVAATVAVVGAVGAWALFRPELLFVNRTVSESLPAAGQVAGMGGAALMALSEGNFRSLGHHTEGKASVYRTADGAQILRLSGFKTSNGPDVHVYLVEGPNGADDATINRGGFLDLGVMKGNIGDQNYALPAGADLGKYQSVSIWCKRFSMNFAAANLAGTGAAASAPAAPVASAAPAAPASALTVTTGQFAKLAHKTTGTATITEDEKGKRVLTLSGFETAQGPKLHVYLLAAETVKDGAAAKKLVDGKQFIDLGDLKKTAGGQTYAVPDDIDLWKYLTVVVWCDQFDVAFGGAPLHAPGA